MCRCDDEWGVCRCVERGLCVGLIGRRASVRCLGGLTAPVCVLYYPLGGMVNHYVVSYSNHAYIHLITEYA